MPKKLTAIFKLLVCFSFLFCNILSAQTIKMVVLIHGTLAKIGKMTLLPRYGIQRSQPISDYGLIRMEQPGIRNEEYTKIYLDLVRKAYQFCKGAENTNLHFYTFGWGGELIVGLRQQAGEDLYSALVAERSLLLSANPETNVEIDIYAHSHGGNVALNLAFAEEKFHQQLFISNLFLLGTPVQEETAGNIGHSIKIGNECVLMFKKVYNVYSLSMQFKNVLFFAI